jgi:hypothetical protein
MQRSRPRLEYSHRLHCSPVEAPASQSVELSSQTTETWSSKSTLRSLESLDTRDEARRLEAILLELRVLTRPPLVAHENIVNLLQLGWEGDTVDISGKWPVLVMEYADLGNLANCFDREPQLP